MILTVTIFVLVTGGVYLILQRNMVRAVFGVSLLSHAANFVILAAGVPDRRAEPMTQFNDPATIADPVPQAFVLTAIVITLASTILMLALSVLGHNDDMRRHPETGETHDT